MARRSRSSRRLSPARIKLQTLVATDQSNQGPALRILFFGAQPTGTTDNAAMDLSAADLTNIIGQIKISAADWETTDSYKFVSLSSLQLILGANVGNADRAIYGTIVADTVWNAGATNDLYLHIGFEGRNNQRWTQLGRSCFRQAGTSTTRPRRRRERMADAPRQSRGGDGSLSRTNGRGLFLPDRAAGKYRPNVGIVLCIDDEKGFTDPATPWW